VRGWLRTQRGLVPVARWLGRHSPPTAGWLDPSVRPEYGVLAPWGDGHLLRWIARRPVVQDNFGDDVGARSFELAERYYAADTEAEALDILRELRVRYVVVRGSGSGHGAGYGPASMLVRLHRLRGSSGSVKTGEGASRRVPALEHHRPPRRPGRDERAGRSRPAYALEVVPGPRRRRRAGRASRRLVAHRRRRRFTTRLRRPPIPTAATPSARPTRTAAPIRRAPA
jgi:hypothetical protein